MIKVDAEKLTDMIRDFVRDTHGMCVSTGAVIGVIDGKEIRLTVSLPDCDEEVEKVHPKWKCVED